jgi:hypothetical protein
VARWACRSQDGPRSPHRDHKSAGIAVAGATAGTHAGRLVIPIRVKQHAPKLLAPQLAGHSVDVHENECWQALPAVLNRAMRKLDQRLL